MAMRPIAPDILDAIMTRMRANKSTFEQERARLHVDADRLRHQLRSRFADYQVVMNRHKKHSKQAVVVEPKPGKPRKKLKRAAKQTGFVDTRYQTRLYDEQADHMRREIAAGRLRIMEDFSDDEIAELTAKVRGWIAMSAGLSSVYAIGKHAGEE